MATNAAQLEGCSLIWKSGLLFQELKQANKLRRRPHYHYTYSIIKSAPWVCVKVESVTAVRLLAKDFSIAADAFSRDSFVVPWKSPHGFFEYANNICLCSLSCLSFLCLPNASGH